MHKSTNDLGFKVPLVDNEISYVVLLFCCFVVLWVSNSKTEFYLTSNLFLLAICNYNILICSSKYGNACSTKSFFQAYHTNTFVFFVVVVEKKLVAKALWTSINANVHCYKKLLFLGENDFFGWKYWSRSYQTLFFFAFRFSLLSLSVCKQWKKMYLPCNGPA